MTNPIRNAVVPLTPRDLVRCKRCGCPDLAWVQFKSGKWAPVQTACRRPLWRGQGPAPEGLFALKFNYHRCEEYRALQAEIERRNSQCHPKADRPAEIVADAAGYLIRQMYANGAAEATTRITNENDPLTAAIHLLAKKAAEVPNLNGVKL